MPLLVVLLDSVRADEVSDIHPFRGIQNSIRGSILPPFSFEPDAAYLTGRYPEDTDSGTHFSFSPETSPFKTFGSLRIGDALPFWTQRILRWTVRRKIQRTSPFPRLRRDGGTGRIPFRLLSYFDVVQKYDPIEPEFCSFPTVFDLMNEHRMRWLYLGAPISSARSSHILRDLKRNLNPDTDFVFLSVGELDGVGHRFGPDSAERRGCLEKTTVFLQKIIELLGQTWGEFPVLIFGDHGMARIDKLVDIQQHLSRFPFRCGKDYVCFLDSTLARFWFFSQRARKEIVEMLEGIEQGSLISDDDRRDYHIRYSHNRFGEVIWWANGETMIFPNFWQDRNPIKGMHGYRHEVVANRSGFLLTSPELNHSRVSAAPVKMVDVFATIIETLQLRKPDGANGVSVCRYSD